MTYESRKENMATLPCGEKDRKRRDERERGKTQL